MAILMFLRAIRIHFASVCMFVLRSIHFLLSVRFVGSLKIVLSPQDHVVLWPFLKNGGIERK